MHQTEKLSELRIDRGSEVLDRPRRRWPVPLAMMVVILGSSFVWLGRGRVATVELATVRNLEAGAAAGSVLDGSGYVTARREAVVSSKVTGKIVEVLVEEGMVVAEGQLLARLDDSLVRGALGVAEAERETVRATLAETRALLAEADLALERSRNLVAEGFSARADFDAAIARRDTLAARLEREKRQLDTAASAVALRRTELDDMMIRSPFAGVAVSKDAQPGEMISPVSGGGFTRTGVATVVDMTSLEIEVDVNEAYIQRVSPGQEVVATLDAYPTWKIPAHVITLVPTADRQKATVRVRIGFDALDPRILPDMAVKVSFVAPTTEGAPAVRSVVLVPRRAMVADGSVSRAFVVQGERVESRAISTGAARGEDLEVTAGLSAGERVVLDPPADLLDGDKIREKQP